MILRYCFIFGLAVALPGCDRPSVETPANRQPSSSTDSTADRPTVMFLGTSLTAGFGIDPEQAYPALIQKKIDSAGLDYQVINAGLSGETSAGALRRVEWLFQQPLYVLVVETGANDGLRGLPTDSLRANIQAILDRAKRIRPPPKLVLVGMRVPPNYGKAYSQGFQAIYPELARANGAILVPFLLQDVGGIPDLNQPDGVHPTAAGQRKLAETVWRVLEPVLREDGKDATKNPQHPALHSGR
jgi:acyl-CoA thioesterase I